MSTDRRFVSRAGEKLDAALDAWEDVLPSLEGIVAADLGANVGGFTDCLLTRGAKKVYAIDTGYGVLDWSLRNDDRVVVMERTNALHAELPEPVDLVVVDVAWTPQRYILPAAWRMVRDPMWCPIVSLIKPQYEATESELGGRGKGRRGVLTDEQLPAVLERIRADVRSVCGRIVREIDSPIRGSRGNAEFLWLILHAEDSKE